MKWDETIASRCRYGEVAQEVWGTWDILWEDSEADYQGHASFLAKKGNKYCFYEWWYGSCSGCDGWENENLTDEEIKQEMQDTAIWFNGKKSLKRWLENLDKVPVSNYGIDNTGGLASGLDMLCGGLGSRINAIRKELGMPALDFKE